MITKLIGGGRNNQTFYWDWGKGSSSLDNPKFFNKNKKSIGPSWYYYDKDISYIHNNEGFRTYNFNEIKWEESIVILGCSITYGVANALEDSIPAIIEKITEIPVINLGVSGAGVDLSCVNSLTLHNLYPRPKAIVQLWSGIHRYCEFISDSEVEHLLPQNKRFCLKHNWKERNKNYVNFDRTIWKNKTVRYEASFFQETSQELKVDFLKTIDKARDLSHPGYASNKIAAEQIINMLSKEGL